MKYVREMEGLRGVMALWVVLGHVATTVGVNSWWFRNKLFNNYAVDVFILLSGFAIAAMLHNKQEDYRTYIARRFLRIFPVYLLFLALSVAIAPITVEIWQSAPAGFMRENRVDIATETMRHWWPHLIAHVTALHGLIPPSLLPRTDYAFLGQAWSISLEWQFYLVAPFFLAWLAKPRKSLRELLFATAVCVLLAVIGKVLPAGFLGRSLHEFALGALTFEFMLARERRHSTCAAISIPLAWAAVVAVCIFWKSVDMLPYAIWATVVAAALEAREKQASGLALVSRFLCTRPAQFIGRMAYSVYLSHMLVIVAGLVLLRQLGMGNVYSQSVALAIFTVIGTLLVSFASYQLVERPFHELGRALRPKPGQLTAAPEATVSIT